MKFLKLLLILIGLQVLAQDALPLKNAVGVVVSPKGLNNIGANADSFIDTLGLQLDTFKVARYQARLDEIHSKNLSSNPKIKKLISMVIKNLSKYFEGLNIKPHKVAVDLQGLVAHAKLNEIQARFVFSDAAAVYNESKRYFDTELKIVVSDIRLNVSKIRGKDLNNDYLGEIGFNNFKLSTASRQSHPLEIIIPIRVYKEEKRVSLDFLDPKTNLKKIYFDLGFDNPLIFPEVAIQINNKSFPLKIKEVEKFITKGFRDLMPKVKDWVEDNADQYLFNMVEEKINEFLQTEFNVINEMQPPGAPADKKVLPMAWKIVLDEIDMSSKGLLLSFDGDVNDPQTTEKHQKLDNKYYASKGVGFYGDSSKYDISVLFNQGFFNHFILASFNRGYLRRFQFGKEKIALEKVPLVRVDSSGRLKIDLMLNYWVKGIAKLIAKNPLRIKMELFLKVQKLESGSLGLVVDQADVKSLQVDKKRFRWPFRSLGSKQAKKKILKIKDSLNGYVLTDSIPVPSHIGEFRLNPVKAEIHKGGYIIIHNNLSKAGGIQ